MQLNFGRIFVNTDILGSSDYSNTTTYLKIVHQTYVGVVIKHHLKRASQKNRAVKKHSFGCKFGKWFSSF